MSWLEDYLKQQGAAGQQLLGALGQQPNVQPDDAVMQDPAETLAAAGVSAPDAASRQAGGGVAGAGEAAGRALGRVAGRPLAALGASSPLQGGRVRGLGVNMQSGARQGQAFTRVSFGGREFHVYDTADGPKVIALPPALTAGRR